MKIIITGSLGNVSKPLAQELIQKKHDVTIVSSDNKKKSEIEGLGAKAAIGTLEDVDFLAKTFEGADAAYCMVPPNHMLGDVDVRVFCQKIANNYAEAIKRSRVKRVVHLSSIGAHMEKDSGLILAHRDVETILKQVNGIGLTHMRPVGFYYNLLAFIPAIKHAGVITSNYGGDDRLPWVAPVDIAAAVADEIVKPLDGNRVRYVCSDEPSCNEVAKALGAAIGKPDLKWELISDEQMEKRLTSHGMSASTAKGLAEMNAAIHRGELQEHYYKNRPILGKVKIEDYAKEFGVKYRA